MLLTLILLSTLLGVVLLHLLTLRHRRKYRHLAALPIPPSLRWIVGHGPAILGKAKVMGFNLTPIMEAFRADLGGADTIVIFSPALYSPLVYSTRVGFYTQVLSDHRTFLKQDPALDWVHGRRILGPTGILLDPGSEVWYHKRKHMDPAFKKKFLRVLMEKMNSKASKLSCYLEDFQDSNVNIYPVLMRTALEIVASCGFNMPEDFITTETSPINTAVADIFRVGALKIFNGATFWMPWKFRAEKELMFSQAKYLRDMMAERLGARFEKIAAGEDHTDDILSYIIRANQFSDKLTIQDLVDDFLVFLMAGMETTAITMSIIMWHLLKHQHVYEKLRDEVMGVFGDKEHLEFDDLTKLVYLEQCFKEVLRIHPPSQITFRKTPDTVQTVDTIRLPPNTRIVISIEGIQHAPENWEDPLKFDPDRFNPGDMTHKPFTFLPFAAGPRSCIGKHFAMMEAKVIIARLVKDFVIYDDYPEVRELAKQTTLLSRPKDGVLVRLQRK